MGFLEIARADFRRGNLCSDRQHRYARAVGIEQAVDQVQVARPAATRADGQRTGEVGFRPGGKGGDFFVTHMYPLDIATAAYHIGEAVKAVAHHAIDALDAGGNQGSHELFGDGLAHAGVPR